MIKLHLGIHAESHHDVIHWRTCGAMVHICLENTENRALQFDYKVGRQNLWKCNLDRICFIKGYS